MARVNVEETFFANHSRIRKFAKLMGWEPQKAIGTLLLIWHESQEALKAHGTADDILFWSQLKKKSDRAKLIAALSDDDVHYISKFDENQYEIHGNAVQIDNRVKKISASAKGGNTTKRKWEAYKKHYFGDLTQGHVAIHPASREHSLDQAQVSSDQTRPDQCISAVGVDSSSPGTQNPWDGVGMTAEARQVLEGLGMKFPKPAEGIPVENRPTLEEIKPFLTTEQYIEIQKILISVNSLQELVNACEQIGIRGESVGKIGRYYEVRLASDNR